MKNKYFRIIDANINRATEGLRVVEEISRFILENKALAGRAKTLRVRIGRVIDQQVLKRFRDSQSDPGRNLHHSFEGKRATLNDLFISNIKRAEEALRCLEEFAKQLSPAYGKHYKELRFQTYSLEKALAPLVEKLDKLDTAVMALTSEEDEPIKEVKYLIKQGAKVIQFRAKDLSPVEYLRLAKIIVRLAREAGRTIILNDHANMVAESGADGIHLGQADLEKFSLKRLRKTLGAASIIGVSVSNVRQAKAAEKAGADYLGVGPVFATPNKISGPVVGLPGLRKIVQSVSIPVVAIGGINQVNLDRVFATGCQKVAAIRGAVELLRLAKKREIC